MAIDDLSKLRIDRTVKKEKSYISNWKFLHQNKTKIALLVIALILISFIAFYKSDVSVEIADVSQIYPSQAFTILNASGYVVAERKAAVASKITGRLESLSVEEGSRIKKGEVIAKLENEDAQAAYNQAAANLNVARHNLDQARAECQDALIGFKRSDELIHKGFIARSEYDSANARYQKAQAGVSAAEAGVKANAAAVQAAKTNIEYALIRAPFDAVVLTKNADIGDIVTPLGAAANAKASVVSIADMNSLQVEADVSETNVAKIRMKQPCAVQLDAIPERHFRGEVHMIVPTADRNKASIMVKVRFLEKDLRILPDMSAKVSFLSRAVSSEEEKPRVALPNSAVVSRKGKSLVYLFRDGKAHETPIAPGERFGDMVEITAGVKLGDKLVMNPPVQLKDGSKIRAVEK